MGNPAWTPGVPPKNAWQKGQSGNPAGRPPSGTSWAELARQIGGQTVEHPELGPLTRRRLVLLKVYEMAMRGDMRAVEFLSNREDGQPPRESGGEINVPIRILLLDEADPDTEDAP